MITESLITVFGDMLLFFLGEMEPVELPGWLTSLSGLIGTIFGSAGQMGIWFNWGLLGVVVVALLGVQLFSFGFHVLRMIVSVFTGGGGKA